MATQTKKSLRNFIRALRLPFITASILPFILGSLAAKGTFSLFKFTLGLISVIATHLSSNLINDYADSCSGVDWQDKNFYKFFGGSKLIQEDILNERFYLEAAISFAVIAFLAVITLAIILKSLFVIGIYLAIIFLGWSYSEKPLKFSYRRMGEIIIFILFGPVPVMGGYFIQTKIFPDWRSLVLSLPFGFFTTAILFANEIADFGQDSKAGKFTWVNFLGQKNAYILYYLLMLLGFCSIFLGSALRILSPVALIALIFIFPMLKAAKILKNHPTDKLRLIESSKLTIAVQAMVGITLILGVVLCTKS